MLTTQLVCPHCNSTLNFGVAINAGTPVNCLICMQAFVASNPVSVPIKSPSPAPKKAAPSPAPAPKSSGVSVKTPPAPETRPAPKPASKPEKRVPAPAESGGGSSPVVLVFTIALLLLLTAGLAFGVWRMTAGKGEESNDTPDKNQVADNSKTIPTGDDAKKKVGTPDPPKDTKKTPNEKPVVPQNKLDPEKEKQLNQPPPKISQQEDDDLRNKIAQEANDVLKRKNEPPKTFEGKVVRVVQKDQVVVQTAAKKEVTVDVNEHTEYVIGGKTVQFGALKADLAVAVEYHERNNRLVAMRIIGATQDAPPPKVAATPKQKPVVGLTQQRIDATIAKGIAFLKKTQRPDGSWEGFQEVGHAALCGLTMLECNVPAKDDAVQKAAGYVRARMAESISTYELSSAILFLDRLGDPADRPMIQGMALRLIANQGDSGAWGYVCEKKLYFTEMHHLYSFLHLTRPAFQKAKPVPFKRDPGKANDLFENLGELIATKGTNFAKENDGGGLIPNVNPKPPQNGGGAVRADDLLPILRQVPAVKFQGMKRGQIPLGPAAGADNSNTQFAILALWTARRHDIVSDQALINAHQYFLATQNNDGGWGYMAQQPTRDSMINVGLLGMALGHGVQPDMIDAKKVKPALQDPRIQAGLQLLSRYIGQPVPDLDKVNLQMRNLYFLWCVERVAVLYDLDTIGGKDWYSWGAQILVRNQRPDGEWQDGNFHNVGAPGNTCFALLFLRRSNLVQDLTENFRIGSFIRK